MPTCGVCNYRYDYFVQNYCPRCRLRELVQAPNPHGPQAGKLKQQIRDRWTQILSQKDVDQGPFGICGMAAALHVLLLQRPQTASDLAAATFWDLWRGDTVIPDHPGLQEFPAGCGSFHIDLPYLIRRDAEMWHQQRPKLQKDVHDAAPGTQDRLDAEAALQAAPLFHQQHFTDFCVSRALGYLLKAADPSRYTTEKCDFNTYFGEPRIFGIGSRKYYTRAGNLALRTDTLAFILRDLLGANVTIAHNCIARNDPAEWEKYYRNREQWLHGVVRKQIGFDTHTKTLKTLQAGVQQMIDGIARALRNGSFVIAAIDARLINPGPPPPENLKFDHWVVIKSVGGTPNDYQLKIWSWARTFDVTGLTDEYAADHIYDLIVGRFWSGASSD